MIIIVLLLSTLIRSININQSLWLDEAINLFAVKTYSYRELITNYSLGDFHPPLYHLILKFFLTYFPDSEIFARLPSVLFGIGTVYVVFLIGKKLFETKTAAIAAILLATSPLHIYYSQEARMYSLAALLSSLSVFFFVSLIKKDSIYNWIGFIASSVLMLYSDYLPYLMIPVYFIYIITFRKRITGSTIKAFFPAFLLIFISIAPWLLVFPKQFGTGFGVKVASPAWAAVVGSPSVKNLLLTIVKFTIGRISVPNDAMYALLFVPVGFFTLILFAISIFRTSYQRSFLYLWLIVPIVMAFIISFFVPIFAYFRFLFLLPAFYLIWAMAINTLNWSTINRALLICALVINLGATAIYLTNKKYQREDWRGAVTYVKQQAKENSITIFEADSPFAPFTYYNKGELRTSGAVSNFNANMEDVDKKMPEIVAGYTQVFLFQYLSGITDPQGYVFQSLTKLGYTNISTKDFPQIGFVYEFKR